jgi:biotin transport system ATP-binding protein
MRHIIGLARPDSGRVLYRGVDIQKDLKRTRTGIGLVFQDSEAQIIGQTIGEDVAFGPANLGLPLREIQSRTQTALRLLHLEGMTERSPDGLSGGERRRLAIAGVMAMEPECLIFDEPFANLDFPSIRQLLASMNDLHEGGRTIIVLTHELEKLLAHATRLVVMDSGAIVYDGDPEPPDRTLFSGNGLADPYRHAAKRADLTWLA